MNEAFSLKSMKVQFLDESEWPHDFNPDDACIWIEGLFPLLSLELLSETWNALKLHEKIVAYSHGRSEVGILAVRKFSDLTPDFEMETWVRQHGPHRLNQDPFHLFPLRGPKDYYSLCQHFFQEKRDELMNQGVYLMEPLTTWVETRVHLEPGVWLEPNVQITGMTTIHAGARVSQGCIIENSSIGAHSHIKPYSVICDSTLGDKAVVGPFANIRPGCQLGENTKVGNFVEAKNVKLGAGSKASHLTYLGDADIGRDCNIGAGTITCNYDGVNKNKTILGDRVFIGSDSQLIAPVTLGDDSYVAAGSSISKDVPANALGIARARQENKLGLAEKIRERARKQKEAGKK